MSERAGVVSAIMRGGLAAGLLDTLLAMSLWQISPVTVYQSVASGLLGRASYRGGLATAALGMFLHFFIATTAAAVFWFARRKMNVLVRHWFVCGLAFGVAVYYFMQLVVLPLSNAVRGRPALWREVGSVVGHAFLVGLPIAWFSRGEVGSCELRVVSCEQEQGPCRAYALAGMATQSQKQVLRFTRDDKTKPLGHICQNRADMGHPAAAG